MIPAASKPANAEKTFVVAATLLGLVALVQLAAAVLAVLPEVRFAGGAGSASADDAGGVSEGAGGAAGEPTADQFRQANELLARAESAATGGDLPAALDLLQQADQVIPGEPVTIFQMGVIHENLGNSVDAGAAYQTVLAAELDETNPVYANIRQQAALRLEALTGEAAPGADAGAGATSSGSGAQAESLQMRDEVGIPIGSVLGIVDCRIVAEDAGYMQLRVATKASPAETIDPGALKVVVFFYEENGNGEVLPTQSGLMSEWLSPPIDWTNAEPELLNVKYAIPLEDRGDLAALEYHGYVVGIYYNGELQDSRAEPVALLDEFPLELTITDQAP